MLNKHITLNIKDLEGELWLSHPEDFNVFISNKGRCKSKDKYILKKDNSEMFSKGRLYKVHYDKDGYCRISIVINNIKKTYSIHRLVAETFIPNPESKPQVNHINGLKDDNRAENLEWVTIGENRRHDIKFLRKSKNPGVHTSGTSGGYVSLFKHDNIEYNLGYCSDKDGIPDLMKKYNNAVFNFEKYGILPELK